MVEHDPLGSPLDLVAADLVAGSGSEQQHEPIRSLVEESGIVHVDGSQLPQTLHFSRLLLLGQRAHSMNSQRHPTREVRLQIVVGLGQLKSSQLDPREVGRAVLKRQSVLVPYFAGEVIQVQLTCTL